MGDKPSSSVPGTGKEYMCLEAEVLQFILIGTFAWYFFRHSSGTPLGKVRDEVCSVQCIYYNEP